MAETIRLWVYGTLKKGGRLHGAMRGASFLACCRSVPGYQLLKLGWYPGLVRVPCPGPGDTVAGELYEVPVEMLDRLDEAEGAPALFRREPVALPGHPQAAQAYFYQGPVVGRAGVPGGEWPVG